MSRTGDQDDMTVRHDSGETMHIPARDDTAQYTVPQVDDQSTGFAPPPAPPGLPRRIPSQFTPPVTASTGESRGQASQSASIRIGSGVPDVMPLDRSRSQKSSRGGWARITQVLSSVALVVLVGAVAWTIWQWWHSSQNNVRVTSIAVAPAQQLDGKCDVQYDIVGSIATNGKAGTISYVWVRSDGQNSGTLKQSVSSGEHSTKVHLYWKFTGQGSMSAKATLEILEPKQAGQASAEFPYSCQ